MAARCPAVHTPPNNSTHLQARLDDVEGVEQQHRRTARHAARHEVRPALALLLLLGLLLLLLEWVLAGPHCVCEEYSRRATHSAQTTLLSAANG
jgi:hypothetical protein